ncbi:MAG: gamma-glutamyl-gamma-aminobutyrate hydrolase family protein [Thermoleophilia bacterium]
MPSPVIGICTAMERARWSVWDMPAALVPMNYVEHVQRAGGIALLVPPDPALVEDPGPALDRVDGLLLVGGADLDAALYGAVAHPTNDPPIPLRDAGEIALVRAARGRGMPVLGICRGIQIINVAAGGDLVQHLPETAAGEEHRRAIGRFAGNEHDVVLDPGSRARDAAGEPVHRVFSHHHQALGRLGEGLRVTGRAPDGITEAVEDDGAAWLLGVQWHPEADPGSGIIAGLVAAARDSMMMRAGTEEKGADSSIPAARRDERS